MLQSSLRPHGLLIYAPRNILRLMIKSFADKATAAVFADERSRKLPSEPRTVARRKLAWLNAAGTVEQLRVPPGNRLEKLSGNREGYWSIRLNDQWRPCFRSGNGDAYDVEIFDDP